jgi:hypothetical protein
MDRELTFQVICAKSQVTWKEQYIVIFCNCHWMLETVKFKKKTLYEIFYLRNKN